LLLVGIVWSSRTRLTILLLLLSTAAYLERLRDVRNCSRNRVESFITMLLLWITQSTKSTSRIVPRINTNDRRVVVADRSASSAFESKYSDKILHCEEELYSDCNNVAQCAVAGSHCSFLRKLGEDKLARPFLQKLRSKTCSSVSAEAGSKQACSCIPVEAWSKQTCFLAWRLIRPSREWTLSRFTKEQVL
jgi:hypothetical protein